MIYFYNSPTKLFKSLVEYALDLATDDIEMIFEDEEFFFDKEATRKMGGNEELCNAVREINKIYRAPELYEISEYYWLVLDSILYNFCQEYNDTNNLSRLELDNERGCLVSSIMYDKLATLYLEITSEIFQGEDENIVELVKNKKIERIDSPPQIKEDGLQDSEWACVDCSECTDEQCDYRQF